MSLVIANRHPFTAAKTAFGVPTSGTAEDGHDAVGPQERQHRERKLRLATVGSGPTALGSLISRHNYLVRETREAWL